MLDGLARLVAWASLVAIAVLSLLPGSEMVRSGMGGHTEHVIAYAFSMLAVVVAHRRVPVIIVAGALVGYAGCLEYLQGYVPGRRAAMIDLGYSAMGVAIGLAVWLVLKPVAEKWRPFAAPR